MDLDSENAGLVGMKEIYAIELVDCEGLVAMNKFVISNL